LLAGNITAISHRRFKAKNPFDIDWICQIFFNAKCIPIIRVSQVLTKTSLMGYSQHILIAERRQVFTQITIKMACDPER